MTELNKYQVPPMTPPESNPPFSPSLPVSMSQQRNVAYPEGQSPTSTPTCAPSEALESDVEGVIRGYGYTPLAKVMVKLTDGQQRGLFIKALNPLGMLVFVHLDSGGQVSVDKRDLTVVEKGSFDMIPYSIKEASYKNTAPYARGVAISCDKGICVIHHDNNNPGAMSQIGFEFQQSPTTFESESSIQGQATVALQHREKVMADDSLNVLPIVSLQDIKANHLLVLQHTEIATNRIMALSHQSCINDILTFNQAYSELSSKANQFASQYQETRKLLTITSSQFREYARYYLRSPSRDPSAIANYNNSLYNLRVRAEALQELNRCCRAFEGYASKLREITADLSVLVEHCISSNGKYTGAVSPR